MVYLMINVNRALFLIQFETEAFHVHSAQENVSGRTVSSEMFDFRQNESTKKVMCEDLECIIKTNK